MAIFNFIETFFFISLGITFVLILLLVNHFKQRISGLEQKCDTMFEIINDVVKQINVLRIQNNVPFNMSSNMTSNMTSNMPSNMPFMNLFNPLSQSKLMPQFHDFMNEKIDEDDDEYDEEDDEDEDDEDGDDQDDDEDDEDEDDEDDDDDEDENNDSIKIINVNINDSNDIEPIIIEELSEHNENENENENDDDIQEIDNNSIREETDIEPIYVEKIIPNDDSPLDNTIYDKETEKESQKEIYKKMSLAALKTLVISKGLCSDASKLKKQV